MDNSNQWMSGYGDIFPSQGGSIGLDSSQWYYGSGSMHEVVQTVNDGSAMDIETDESDTVFNNNISDEDLAMMLGKLSIDFF